MAGGDGSRARPVVEQRNANFFVEPLAREAVSLPEPMNPRDVEDKARGNSERTAATCISAPFW